MSYDVTELATLMIIFVPLNGRTGDGERSKNGVKNEIILIEDSTCLGSNYSKKSCGSLGDISVFSFTHKIITMGQGGMILTNNKEMHENIIELKTFNGEG